MATFKWEDERLPLLASDDMLVGEIRWVERQLGGKLADLGTADAVVASVLVSLKRRNIHMQAKDFDDWPVSRFGLDTDDEPDEDEPTPTTPGAEAGSTE